MSNLERLLAVKATIDSLVEDEIAQTNPPEESDCAHPNREDITGAGSGPTRNACPDCGKSWEIIDAN